MKNAFAGAFSVQRILLPDRRDAADLDLRLLQAGDQRLPVLPVRGVADQVDAQGRPRPAHPDEGLHHPPS